MEVFSHTLEVETIDEAGGEFKLAVSLLSAR